jgi:SAM-dependent methyltransferase
MGDCRSYLPAAGHDWLLPFYDPLLKLLGEKRVKGELIDQAGIRAGHRVLDIGCGTGTLAILVKRRHPEAEVVGLDPDPKALARARRKAEAAGTGIRFDEGFANKLPYPDASLDRVFSSLMFHHLEREAKLAMLRELRRESPGPRAGARLPRRRRVARQRGREDPRLHDRRRVRGRRRGGAPNDDLRGPLLLAGLAASQRGRRVLVSRSSRGVGLEENCHSKRKSLRMSGHRLWHNHQR